MLPLSQPNGQTHRLYFWHEGYVEEYLGQIHRSKVKVRRSKNIHLGLSLISHSLVYLPGKKLRNMTGRNSMWGVFKAFVFFIHV